MRGVKRTTPLLKLCDRPGCGGFRVVRKPCEQRGRSYCSHRCAALASRPWQHVDVKRSLAKALAARRRHTWALIEACATKFDAFMLGYRRGVSSKHRALKRAIAAGKIRIIKSA